MSQMERSRRAILSRLSAGTTLFLSVHLALEAVPAWADGVDADGRTVVLVGRHALGQTDEAKRAVSAVLSFLRAGEVPDGVMAVGYAPEASTFIAEAVAGDAADVLADGPRGTGKTQAVPAALAILAEWHGRAGYPFPLHVLWLHDSLTNASIKTGRSLEGAVWNGLWSVRDDRRVAALVLAGKELAVADFVGCTDDSASQRLRAECHVMAAEELIPSLDDAGGIEERKYDLATSSQRLPTPRHVSISTTNPGAPDTWPYKRWLEAGGQPGTKRCPITAFDRMTEEERHAQARAFATDPDLAARLVRGEWAELIMGEVVARGFRAENHVAPARILPFRGVPLLFGHDAGLTPTTLIGQEVQGEVRILAALVSDRAGTRQHLEHLVIPWLMQYAPWFREVPLLNFYDGSMDTPDESNLESSPLNVLRAVLGGSTYPGAVSWHGRRDPLLKALGQLNPATGRGYVQLDPEHCRKLISALSGRWIYPTVNGVVSRELPLKNHPWSDLGDALCYLVGGLSSVPSGDVTPIKVETAFSLDPPRQGAVVGVGLW